jgi:hypothetical protein
MNDFVEEGWWWEQMRKQDMSMAEGRNEKRGSQGPTTQRMFI